jgi:hypothetical protein
MLTESEKIDILFKKMFGKAYGSSDRQFWEETIRTTPDIHASDIFSQEIPQPQMFGTDTIKKWYPAEEGGDGILYLSLDNYYSGNRVWIALNTWSDTFTSSIPSVDIMRSFISPKYDPGYEIQVLDANNLLVPNTDYYYDYRAGVLAFQADRVAETGNTTQNSVKIKAYQYLGKNLSQVTITPRHVQHFPIAANSSEDLTLELEAIPYSYEHLDVYRNGILLLNIEGSDYFNSGTQLIIHGQTYANEIITVKYQ